MKNISNTIVISVVRCVNKPFSWASIYFSYFLCTGAGWKTATTRQSDDEIANTWRGLTLFFRLRTVRCNAFHIVVKLYLKQGSQFGVYRRHLTEVGGYVVPKVPLTSDSRASLSLWNLNLRFWRFFQIFKKDQIFSKIYVRKAAFHLTFLCMVRRKYFGFKFREITGDCLGYRWRKPLGADFSWKPC